jgi:hypothetical protein
MSNPDDIMANLSDSEGALDKVESYKKEEKVIGCGSLPRRKFAHPKSRYLLAWRSWVA